MLHKVISLSELPTVKRGSLLHAANTPLLCLELELYKLLKHDPLTAATAALHSYLTPWRKRPFPQVATHNTLLVQKDWRAGGRLETDFLGSTLHKSLQLEDCMPVRIWRPGEIDSITMAFCGTESERFVCLAVIMADRHGIGTRMQAIHQATMDGRIKACPESLNEQSGLLDEMVGAAFKLALYRQ